MWHSTSYQNRQSAQRTKDAEYAKAANVERHDPNTCSYGLCQHPECVQRQRFEFAAQQINKSGRNQAV